MPFGCGGRYFFGLMAFRQGDPEVEKRSRRIGWPLAFVLVLLLLALLAAFFFYRLETWPGRTVNRSVTRLEQLGREARAGEPGQQLSLGGSHSRVAAAAER